MTGLSLLSVKYKWLLVVLSFILMLLGLAYLFTLKSQVVPKALKIEQQAEPGLGEVGAICGGKLRLPCKPGNVCAITNDVTSEGVCVKISDNPAPVKPN